MTQTADRRADRIQLIAHFITEGAGAVAAGSDLDASVRDGLYEQAEAYFEPQLARLRLGANQVETQSIEELRESLDRVNELIAHPESLGSLKVSMGSALLVARVERHAEVGPLPILLERKSQILRRMAAIRQQEDLTGLKHAVTEAVESPEDQQALIAALEEGVAKAISDASLLERRVAETDEARERAMRLQIEIDERRSAMRRSWLERESIASIIGAFLLLALGLALIVAMFIGTDPAEVVTSAFLLILGYFFGQGATRGEPAPKSRGEDETNIQI